MKIPKYIQDVLRTKKHRALYLRHPSFFRPAIRSLRFLFDERGFSLSELAQQRREIWVTFRRPTPIPLAKPKHLDTFIDVTIETENFHSTIGAISLWSERVLYPALRSFSFERIHDEYSSIKTENPGGGLPGQLAQISNAAATLEENWDDIIHRLTRNIPSKKFNQ